VSSSAKSTPTHKPGRPSGPVNVAPATTAATAPPAPATTTQSKYEQWR
jgi:hypothetical protein